MAGKKNRSGVLAGVGVVAMAAAATVGQARGATLFSTGFESSATYDATTGSNFTSYGYQLHGNNPAELVGQPSISSNQFALYSNDPSNLTYTYDAAVVPYSLGGPQYAQIQDTGISSSDFAVFYPEFTSGGTAIAGTGTPIVDVYFNLNVGQAAAGSNALFGVGVLDGSGNSLAEVVINSSSGAVNYGNSAGNIVQSPTAVVPRSTNEAYDLQLNYSGGSPTYSLSEYVGVAYVPLLSNLPFEGGSDDSTFGAVDLETFGGTDANSSGSAAFDDVSVVSSAVPEPTTASVIIGGLAVAGTRRRRSRRLPSR
jgi:hypothetical protein